jgi:adenylosuccinate lyase
VSRRIDAGSCLLATGADRAGVAPAARRPVITTIGKHSQVSRAMKDGAEKNDLLDRLARDKSFGVKIKDLEGVLEPRRFVGRAPEQVDEFLRDVITPLFAGETASSERLEELKV